MGAHDGRRWHHHFGKERRIARDSKGRIYEERWGLVPMNRKEQSVMTAIQIADPVKRTLLTCMVDGRYVCHVTEYSESYNPKLAARREVRGTRSLALPNNEGFVSHEVLGDGPIEGVEAEGARIRTTYNPGVFGNDNKLTVERELWHSPQLGINLLSKVSDPRFGTQTFTVTNLTRAEPESKFFELPEGFQMVDQRSRGPRVSK